MFLVILLIQFGPTQPKSSMGQQNTLPPELNEVRIVENLKGIVPNITLIDEDGDTVDLISFMAGKPLVLSFAYYSCKNLCSFALDGISEALRTVSLVPGKDFKVATISFDTKDKPEDAKRAGITHRHGFIPDTSWRFFVADSQSIDLITKSVGFYFKREGDQFAHPTVISILTPDLRISRYLYGIEYSSRDLKLALLEASNGKIGTLGDRILLFCYRYDPSSKK